MEWMIFYTKYSAILERFMVLGPGDIPAKFCLTHLLIVPDIVSPAALVKEGVEFLLADGSQLVRSDHVLRLPGPGVPGVDNCYIMLHFSITFLMTIVMYI